MSLILDHINGVRDDNRIENLRIVCPKYAVTEGAVRKWCAHTNARMLAKVTMDADRTDASPIRCHR